MCCANKVELVDAAASALAYVIYNHTRTNTLPYITNIKNIIHLVCVCASVPRVDSQPDHRPLTALLLLLILTIRMRAMSPWQPPTSASAQEKRYWSPPTTFFFLFCSSSELMSLTYDFNFMRSLWGLCCTGHQKEGSAAARCCRAPEINQWSTWILISTLDDQLHQDRWLSSPSPSFFLQTDRKQDLFLKHHVCVLPQGGTKSWFISY